MKLKVTSRGVILTLVLWFLWVILSIYVLKYLGESVFLYVSGALTFGSLGYVLGLRARR